VRHALHILLDVFRVLFYKRRVQRKGRGEFPYQGGYAVAISAPLPAGAPLNTATWEQTPLVVRQWVLQLLDVIQ
jgi:hypothetical protein